MFIRCQEPFCHENADCIVEMHSDYPECTRALLCTTHAGHYEDSMNWRKTIAIRSDLVHFTGPAEISCGYCDGCGKDVFEDHYEAGGAIYHFSCATDPKEVR